MSRPVPVRTPNKSVGQASVGMACAAAIPKSTPKRSVVKRPPPRNLAQGEPKKKMQRKKQT